MCGSVSAIALQDLERELWPDLRERLRQPGHLMALMRGLLGDTEVAVVTAVKPDGQVRPLAVLATSEEVANEIRMTPQEDAAGTPDNRLRRAKVGDYDIEVLVGEWPDGSLRPLAILATPWIEQHLLLFARTLWRGRRT